MSQCLHPCPSCAQHLRASETVCPFCDAALPEGFGICAHPAPRGRPMSRAALLFVGANVAAGCSADAPATMTLYGPAVINDAGSSLDAGTDARSEAATDAQTGSDAPAVMDGPATIDSGD
jgi:hypothetical protein